MHRQEWGPGLELQPGTGSRDEDVLPHQTPAGKTHCSQFFVGVPLRKFPDRAGEVPPGHRNLPTGSVLGEALPAWAEEGRAHPLMLFPW